MPDCLTLDLPTPQATDDLARVLAGAIGAGDALLLEGPIGAGKSHLARALIRARLGNPDEDVPSPTFTLVQTYDADPPIWHADLYRLGHPDEVMELGLNQAFRSAIALVEWPDRLGKDAPKDAIRIRLSLQGEGRQAEVCWTNRPALGKALRGLAADLFLARLGWGEAARQVLAGDASGRRFLRLRRGDETAVLLDNPPGIADRIDAFVTLARHLRGIGLSAPEIFAADLPAGLALIEDLGDRVMAAHLAAHPAEEAALYARAVDLLVAMQAHPAPPGLPNLGVDDWAEAAMLALRFYAKGAGVEADEAELRAELSRALAQYGDGPRVLIHRDFFAGNLMVLDRPGLRGLGVLDFQLGQMGQPVYDLVSLLQDARRDLVPGLEASMLARFAAAVGAGPGLDAAYAVWGVQRALRILGVFARLCLQDGRAEYLTHLPRVWRDLQRNLQHPALTRLCELCAVLPAPTDAVLDRLRMQCGAFR